MQKSVTRLSRTRETARIRGKNTAECSQKKEVKVPDERGDNGEPVGLPVTAEVGGEGGSYADGSVQVETKQQPLRKLEGESRPEGRPGAVAGAVPASPEGPEDGIR
jgi:hypothetical protein